MCKEKEEVCNNNYRFGSVAIIGRPNVGKSTLLNAMIGHKLSITSRKPQTTRHSISGILTTKDCQYVFVDTPGFQTKYLNLLNRNMNRVVRGTVATVDVIIFLIEAPNLNSWDESVLELIPKGLSVIGVINKVDRLSDKVKLLPLIEKLGGLYSFEAIVPMSAKSSLDVDNLLKLVRPYLPKGEAIYEPDQFTDKSERFLVAEIIREKIFRLTGDELPYATTVSIDRFEDDSSEITKIFASILVDQMNHKIIIIGKAGTKLKRIGTDSRHSIERLLGKKIYLELFVKVKTGWADREATLRSYGYI